MALSPAPIQCDPALREAILNRGGTLEGVPPRDRAHELVPVVARLHEPFRPVAGMRVVARFGPVVTARVVVGRLMEVRKHPNVASLKASRGFGGELDASVPAIRAHPSLQAARGLPPLDGSGVVVGVLDWGIDPVLPAFRRADGSTRIRWIWDQRGGAQLESPAPYGYGRELPAARIDRALQSADPYAFLRYDPASADPLGDGTHGTHVADIAAGSGHGGAPAGVAPGADLIFVHLRGDDTRPAHNLGDSVRLLEAARYVMDRAGDAPVVLNCSLGRTGGPHDATTLVEQGFDALVEEAPGRAIVMSTGNYFASKMHAQGRVATGEMHELVWEVPSRRRGFSEMEVWYAGSDDLSIELVGPGGSPRLAVDLGESQTAQLDGIAVASVHNRHRDPNNHANHIDVFLREEAPGGRWRVRLHGRRADDGRFHAWIERDSPGDQSHFAASDADPGATVGSICTGHKTLAVGAYDVRRGDRPLGASSAGPTRDGRQKPDLSAPGADIFAAESTRPALIGRAGGGIVAKSGSSMAAPHVTGLVALVYQAALPARLAIDELREILMTTARPVSGGARRYGAGRVDALGAIEEVTRRRRERQEEETMERQTSQRGSVTQLAFADGEPGEAEEALAWLLAPEAADAATDSTRMLEALDPDEVLPANREWGRRLGWHGALGRVAAGLGFTTGSPSEIQLAHAVAAWQASKGLPPTGVLERETWKRIQPTLPPDAPVTPTRTSFVPIALDQDSRGGRVPLARRTIPPPSKLVWVPGLDNRARDRRVRLHEETARAWRAMVEAARRDGLPSPLLLPISGFRTKEQQAAIRKRAEKRHGADVGKFAARAGMSSHQSGRAMDLYLGISLDSRFSDLMKTFRSFRWLATNAERFGFYPLHSEAWHWEYNPPATAAMPAIPRPVGQQLPLTQPSRTQRSTSQPFTPRRSTPQPASPYPVVVRPVRRKGKVRGYAGYGGGRLTPQVEALRASGRVQVTDRDIDTMQRIADVETRGEMHGINTWDSGVVSWGFHQWTLRHGKVQRLIRRAPDGFARYGIEIEGEYSFGRHKQPGIRGASRPSALRSRDWAERFLRSGFDEDLMVVAIERSKEELKELDRRITRERFPERLLIPRVRGLFAELRNNRPAYLRPVLRGAVPRLTSQTTIPELLPILQEEMEKQYVRESSDPERQAKLRKKAARIVGRAAK